MNGAALEDVKALLIRPAVEDDAPGLARVIVDTGRIAHRGQVPDHLLDFPPVEEQYARSERNWRRALREIAARPDATEQVFVAVADGRVAGFGMGGPRRLPEPEFAAYAGEVNVLYVLPAYQGRGIGRQLVRAVFQHLVDAGLLPVVIGCLTANAPARRFYEALGGRVVGERLFEDEGELLPETVYGWTAEDVVHLLRTG